MPCEKIAGHLDHKALEIISRYVDKALLNRISTLPFTKEAMSFFNQALKNQILYKDWLISGIGFIEQKHRDTMGLIGDFLLKQQELKAVVVFGIVEKDSRLTLDASFQISSDGSFKNYKFLFINSMIFSVARWIA